jgi:hypothetical protein
MTHHQLAAGRFDTQALSPELTDWGYTNMVCLGTERSWQAIKSELYRQQLVHSEAAAAAAQGQVHGPFLHIKVEVDELL